MPLGERLHELRLMHVPRLSQREVALAVGVSRGVIAALEADRHGVPEAPLLIALADALGTLPLDLLTAAGYFPALAQIQREDLDYYTVLRRAVFVRDVRHRRLVTRLITELLVEEAE